MLDCFANQTSISQPHITEQIQSSLSSFSSSSSSSSPGSSTSSPLKIHLRVPMRSKGNIFTRLAKVTLVPFGSQEPFLPGKDAHVGTHSRLRSDVARGFSGTLVPAEARVKTKGAGLLGTPHEPTSPKVSCMGKVKQTKKKSNSKHARRTRSFGDQETEPSSPRKKGNSQLHGLFGRRRKVLASPETMATVAAADRPGLGQVKRLSSRRNALADFDWRSMTDDEDHSTEYSASWENVDDGGAVAELQPREQVNLWKRRTMVRPPELQFKKS